MTLYVIDRDVLIWVLRRDSDAVNWIETAARDGTLACSVLTVAEILAAHPGLCTAARPAIFSKRSIPFR